VLPLGNQQPVRDLLVAHTLGDQPGDLEPPLGQVWQLVIGR
jgi:hypothetical protein